MPQQALQALLIEDVPDVAPVESLLSRDTRELESALAALQQEADHLRGELNNSSHLLAQVRQNADAAIIAANEKGDAETQRTLQLQNGEIRRLEQAVLERNTHKYKP